MLLSPDTHVAYPQGKSTSSPPHLLLDTLANQPAHPHPLPNPGPELSLLQLDVTAPQGELEAKIKEAISFHGRIDVLIDNAGYTQTGTWEDTS